MANLVNKDKFISDMFDLCLDAKWSPKAVHFSFLDVRANIDSPEYEVEAIPVEEIKYWWNVHIKEANDGDDVAVDRMLKDWWSYNVNSQTYENPWEEHKAFLRWMRVEENGKAN